MPMYNARCLSCGWCNERLERIDEYPPCPLCHGATEHYWKAGDITGVIPDDIPGGMIIHNLGHKPVKVYSHSERLRIMRDAGLHEEVAYGGIHDKHLSNWATGRPACLTPEEEAERVRGWHEHEARLQAELKAKVEAEEH